VARISRSHRDGRGSIPRCGIFLIIMKIYQQYIAPATLIFSSRFMSSSLFSSSEGLLTCFYTDKELKGKQNDENETKVPTLIFPVGALSADERTQISMTLAASNIRRKLGEKRVIYNIPGLPYQTIAVSAGPADESDESIKCENIRKSVCFYF
jgi:hypothetical protein